jgi:hypothetical protein
MLKRYGIVRKWRPGSFDAQYDIVDHGPRDEDADVIMANATYGFACFIVDALNERNLHAVDRSGGDPGATAFTPAPGATIGPGLREGA